MSRRRFEDWLKLHVEDDRGAQKKYHELLAGDNKHVPADFVTKDRVMTAVRLAKGRANVGNVYEIIESFFLNTLLKAASLQSVIWKSKIFDAVFTATEYIAK